jgi:WD40 repeat protein
MKQATRRPVVPLLPDDDRICFVVPGAFSAAECAALLTPQVRASYQSARANYPTYYRNNDRLVVDDPALAARLLAAIRPVLPAQLPALGPDEAPWQLLELNPRLRYCRYAAGQYFHRHLDGVYHRSDTVRSRLTFMIYLNDAAGFSGGRTLFYRGKDDPAVWAEYQPAVGDLIVFDHTIWHEGEELTAGEKFVLRSDILYQTTAAPAAPTGAFAEGHLGYIWQLCAFGPDRFVSGGRDALLKVWDAAGHCQQRLRGHENSILCLAQLNADTLLSGSRDATIRGWRRDAAGAFQPAAVLHPGHGTVLTLARLDDEQFASGGADGLIRLGTLGGAWRPPLLGHTDWVWQVLALPEGRLVSVSEDGTLKTWDLATGACLDSQPAGTSVAQQLAYNAATGRLASGHFAGTITIWQARAADGGWQPERTFAAHRGIVRALAWLPGGRLVSGGEDNAVRIWNCATGQAEGVFQHADFVQAVLPIAQGQQVLSASYDGKIQRWPVPMAP